MRTKLEAALLTENGMMRGVLFAAANEKCLRSGAAWCLCATCQARAVLKTLGADERTEANK